MQGSKKWGFIWWATGDDAGRSVRKFLEIAGCPDFRVYGEEDSNAHRTHAQGIPEELKGFPIISNCRNPYAKAVAFFLDVSLERYASGEGELGDMKKWITKCVGHDEVHAHWKEWDKIGTYPTYYIRVESLEEDIKNIPLIIKNAEPEALETALDNYIRKDHFNERRYWLEYPEVKWQKEYDENGQFMWKHFYDQELADTVYEKWEPAFVLQGFDKESWK